MRKYERGFSLIELLVVISIIAILATIAVPVYLGQRSKAMQAEAKANLEALRLLQVQYQSERGEYAPAGATVDGSLDDLADIQAQLPGFKPGLEPNLNFSYKITYTVSDSITSSFIATAVGKSGTPVAGTILETNQDNEKTW